MNSERQNCEENVIIARYKLTIVRNKVRIAIYKTFFLWIVSLYLAIMTFCLSFEFLACNSEKKSQYCDLSRNVRETPNSEEISGIYNSKLWVYLKFWEKKVRIARYKNSQLGEHSELWDVNSQVWEKKILNCERVTITFYFVFSGGNICLHSIP